MNQNWKIGDADKSVRSLFFCDRCKTAIISGSKDDNWLGKEPAICKHWCNKCFEKVKLWIIRQNELLKKLKENNKKESYNKVQLNLKNFYKNENKK